MQRGITTGTLDRTATDADTADKATDAEAAEDDELMRLDALTNGSKGMGRSTAKTDPAQLKENKNLPLNTATYVPV